MAKVKNDHVKHFCLSDVMTSRYFELCKLKIALNFRTLDMHDILTVYMPGERQSRIYEKLTTAKEHCMKTENLVPACSVGLLTIEHPSIVTYRPN